VKSLIEKVAVIGTGVIGTGWIIRFLFNKKKINIYDPNTKQKEFLIKEIKRVEPILKKFYKNKINIKSQLTFCKTLEEAVKDADLIQENAPENENLKTKIIKEISLYAKKNSIIASSSSGLLPTKIQAKCINPKRVIIAHPFNPVYLLPLVEIVPGKKTDLKIIIKAEKFYSNIGMKTLVLKKELPGYLSDRLQESMWRESLHIINEGYASTQDLDDAIIYGPGLRWSLMGTFLTFHLAGGEMGMKHMLEQFGPALKLPWTKLKAPELTKSLKNKIIQGTKTQSKNRSIDKLANLRDNFLIDLQNLLTKYKI
jgi:carnitine 3-dehydrogenase